MFETDPIGLDFDFLKKEPIQLIPVLKKIHNRNLELVSKDKNKFFFDFFITCSFVFLFFFYLIFSIKMAL